MCPKKLVIICPYEKSVVAGRYEKCVIFLCVMTNKYNLCVMKTCLTWYDEKFVIAVNLLTPLDRFMCLVLDTSVASICIKYRFCVFDP